MASASANKRRRAETESGRGGRIFNPSWTNEYFVMEQNNSIMCLICFEKIAVCKMYNVNRHYTTKHAATYDKFKGQFRVAKVELLKKNFIGQQSIMKSKVISSYSATKISFLIAENIAKSGQPFSTGDLIKNSIKQFCNEVCPEKIQFAEDLSLSYQTIARRVEDLLKNIELALKEKLCKCEAYSLALDESTDRSDTAQLAIFIRFITSNFEIIEELLDFRHMKGTTKGEDILSEVKKTMIKFDLPETKLSGVTTDGASSMKGKNIGFVALFKKSINHNILSYHCIIHQEQLCAKVLKMKEVVEIVIQTVNFIRSRGLNHRQFKQLLEDCGSEAEDVIYFCQVRWLSRAATLKRFWILIPEIIKFLKIKDKDTSFLENNDWLNDLAFLVDITQMLMELNIKLQGKDQLISKLYENVETFVLKLKLLKQQLSQKSLIHFKTLSERNTNTVDYEKYCNLILKVIDEFDTRFCDFKEVKNELDLFSHPFSIKVETVRDEFQMELIELQNNKDLKDAYKDVELLKLYKKYMNIEVYPHLCKHAMKYFSLFGSTYICEQFFSRMKHVKSEQRHRLKDEHLTDTLRISSSTIKADIDQLCKNKQCQVSH
ncbi:general transcription factor II-I repeat domain-containing protein 2-like [Hydra vulgaris]|uniref:general transcription factor II-I repeat domain-containing protein 2-like n=1 Tax=Hydra vulgaris TaxID=6087 RepID=UPI001F5FDA64|nr:general transcription factor II-I repeat domain-containing protein 2-like [Hydra vulgaris]